MTHQLKRYLLFSGDIHYPGKGFQDFIESFDTFEKARDVAVICVRESSIWTQIVDTHGSIVMCHIYTPNTTSVPHTINKKMRSLKLREEHLKYLSKEKNTDKKEKSE